MKYLIYGKNLKITPAINNHIYKEFEQIEDFFEEDTKINITLTANDNYHKAEATIVYRGKVIRSERKTDDLYLSISKVSDTIEKQINKYKSKLIDKKQSFVNKKIQYEEEVESEEDKLNIVKIKKFNIKPMTAEEACFQMDLLGHNFFMFLDDETGVHNVVYKRNDNSYGQIIPE